MDEEKWDELRPMEKLHLLSNMIAKSVTLGGVCYPSDFLSEMVEDDKNKYLSDVLRSIYREHMEEERSNILILNSFCSHLFTLLGISNAAISDDSPGILLGEIKKRLMPEGYEWPKDEEEEYIVRGSLVADINDEEDEVWSVGFGDTYWTLFDDEGGELQSGEFGEPVKRSKPKVLDADGVEIQPGEWIYDATDGTPWLVCFQDGKLRMVTGMDTPYHYIMDLIAPQNYTHTKPDTWETIEADSRKDPIDYWGGEADGYLTDKDLAESKMRDLMHRAKKLAGVE